MSSEPGAGPGRRSITLTWLGHSTVVIEVVGVRLVTDPLLRRRIGFLVRTDAAPAREHWADPDAILLSHCTTTTRTLSPCADWAIHPW